MPGRRRNKVRPLRHHAERLNTRLVRGAISLDNRLSLKLDWPKPAAAFSRRAMKSSRHVQWRYMNLEAKALREPGDGKAAPTLLFLAGGRAIRGG